MPGSRDEQIGLMSSYGTTPERVAPPREVRASEAARFTVSDLLRVMRERRQIVLRTAIGVIALTALVLVLLPTVYSATAVVILDQRKNAVADASAVLSTLPTDAASLQNQIQILTSRDLAGTVVDKLDLEADPEFNPAVSHSLFSFLPDIHTVLNPMKWFAPRPPAGTPEALIAEREAVIDNVLGRLSVDTVGLSTSLAVRFAAQSADKSARIANAFAESYVEQQVQQKTEAARQATNWLGSRVSQLADQVQAAETAVEEYKSANNLNETADGTSLTEQQLSAINTQLVQARTDLAAKEATYTRVKALIASGHVADVSQVVASPLIVQLRTQEATLLQEEADLATRYGPMHPKRIAVENQRRDLETKLKQEVDRIAGSLQNDVDVARAQVASLNDSLHHTEHDAAEQNLAGVKLKALEADAASTQSMYQNFVTRLRQTQDQEAIQLSDARVISPAPVPNTPASPHRVVIFAASIPAGILLGLIAALLAERFGMAVPQTAPVRRFAGETRKTPDPVRAAPAPVLASIPDAASIRAADYAIDWPNSDFTQGLNRLMSAIAAPAHGARPRVVAVTAPGPEEGKTAIALGLARIAAKAGWKVALVDGDLLRAPSARTLGFRNMEYGLLDAVQGRAPLSRCFLKDPRSPVLVLSNLAPVSNDYAVLASAVMAQLFQHLRRSADLVIVDATPLAAMNETHALLRHADAVLLAIDPRRTPEEIARRAEATLSAMQAPAVGIVHTA
jgi:uncharacterized protein involved in exopolysaccharide biosynthesis/Mrp family chromosome partitioning ATPase